jgi:hypothetical protein
MSFDTDSLLEIYATSFESVNAKAQAALQSDQWQTLTDVLGAACDGDDYGASKVLQGAIDHSIEYLTLGQLRGASPVTAQRTLNPTALSNLIAGAEGLTVKLPIMFELPSVCVFSDGSSLLAGGNHRLAVITRLLDDSALDEDERDNQLIRCLVYRVNMELFKPLFGDQADALTESQLNNFADTTLRRVWTTSNGSRSVTQGEAKEYAVFSSIPRTVDGIVGAYTSGGIDLKTAFSYLAWHVAKSVNPPEFADDDKVAVFPQDVFDAQGNVTSLTTDTVQKILSSAWRNVVKGDVGKVIKKDGIIAAKAIANVIFSIDSIYTVNAMCETGEVNDDGTPVYALQPIPCTTFQHAVSLGLSQADAAYSNNIARNAAKIGAALGDALMATELFAKYTERQSQPKAAKVKKSSMWQV